MAVVKRVKGKAPEKSSSPEKSSRRKATADLPDVRLPTHDNRPSDCLSDYTICLFGEKGIGKSSLAAQFPGALSFQWEAGRRNLKIRQVPGDCDDCKGSGKKGGKRCPTCRGTGREPPLDWARFKAYVALVNEDPDVRTPIIDTVDLAYIACMDWYCEQEGIDYPSDRQDFGKTWHALRAEFADTMNSMKECGKSPIFVSHAKLRTVTTQTGEEFDLIIPSCREAPWDYLKQVCDIAAYYGYHGKKTRTLILRGDELVWSACGLADNFLDSKTKEPLKIISMGNSEREAYKILEAAFNNKVQNYDPPPPSKKEAK